MPSSYFVFGNFYVAFSALIFCRSLPRFRSFICVACDRRVRYRLRCSYSQLSFVLCGSFVCRNALVRVSRVAFVYRTEPCE